MPVFQSLIVVDPDPRSRGAISFGFEREGCTVFATGDADEALALAETQHPQLVLTTAGAPGVDAVRFVEGLRASTAASLPILAVGERGLRESLMGAGADEYLARPAFIRDLVTLGKLTVEMRRAGSTDELEGDLADYGLYFLARAMHAAGRSGVLFVERQRRSGDLRFERGELAAARVGLQTGSNAFLHLLLWESASFHLRFGDPGTARRIQKPMERLLEDGMRFVAEFEAIAERVGGTHVIYRHDPARLDEVRRQIPPEVAPLAATFDGTRALIDVVEDSPFKPFDTIMIAYRLAEMGVVARVEEAPPSQLAARLGAKDWLLAPSGDASTAQPVQPTIPAGAHAAEGPAPESADATVPFVKESFDAPAEPTAAAGPAPPPVAADAATPTVEERPRPIPVPAPAPPKHHKTGKHAASGGAPAKEKDKPTPAVAAPKPPAAVAAAPEPKHTPVAAAPESKHTPVAAAPEPKRETKPKAPIYVESKDLADMTLRVDKLPPPKQKPQPAATERERPTAAIVTRPAPADKKVDSGRHPKVEFDSLDEDFFAREAELFRVDALETFDDLEPLAPKAGGAPTKKGWFPFAANGDKSAAKAPPARPPATQAARTQGQGAQKHKPKK